MGAEAAGFMVSAAAAAVFAVAIGALGGALSWRAEHGLALGGPATAAAYLVAAAGALGLPLLPLALTWGLPALAMAFLGTSLGARQLNARAGLRPLGAALAALGGAFALGTAYLLLFRTGLWTPVWVALAADAGLVLLAASARKAAPS